MVIHMTSIIVSSDSYIRHLSLPTLQPAPDHVRYILPDYEITYILGIGGFAKVYRAVGPSGKQCAIKIPLTNDLMATMDMEVNERFRSEAEIWKRLDHRNIVILYSGKTEPLPYMIIELMEGGNLKQLMKKHTLSVEEAIHIMEQVLKGLSYAHRMASVHRDLKPENILFTDDGVAKISDWGIGKFMASVGKSQSVGIKGTLDYCAPEQYNKRKYGKVDWQTDIFQIGVMFYEMLTGENPFVGEDFADCMGKVLMYEPEPPSVLNPDVAGELDDVIMGALEKQKEDRWDSGAVMLNELQRTIRRRPAGRKNEIIERRIPKHEKCSKICPKCGYPYEPDDRFCGGCGNDLHLGRKGLDEITPRSIFQEKEETPATREVEHCQETVVVTKMKFTQNEATKMAHKQLADDGGRFFKKKIEKVDAVLLKYLPFVQTTFDVEIKNGLFGLGGKEKESMNLYFHGLNGKLLQVTNRLTFNDITLDKAENIKDFDGIAKLTTLKASMLPIGTEKPTIGEKYLSKKMLKMFGASLKGIKTVYLPVFKFKLTNITTKRSRVLYVDSLFGIPTEKNPFK